MNVNVPANGLADKVKPTISIALAGCLSGQQPPKHSVKFNGFLRVLGRVRPARRHRASHRSFTKSRKTK